MPIVPSQVDPHPSLSLPSFLPSFYQRGHKLSAARPFSNRHIGSSFGRFSSTTKTPVFDESLLGSGDFSVLSGGTFYPEGESSRRPTFDYLGSGSSFHDSTNNGRPFALALESSPDDPFTGFKDFADITAGIDSDFSHHKPIYVNTNGTAIKHEPRNILEQLQMIDEEKRERAEVSTATKPIKDTKLSKFKRKLLSTKEPKKNQTKPKQISPSSSDYVDPLEAAS